jgi:FG-GAP repeat
MAYIPFTFAQETHGIGGGFGEALSVFQGADGSTNDGSLVENSILITSPDETGAAPGRGCPYVITPLTQLPSPQTAIGSGGLSDGAGICSMDNASPTTAVIGYPADSGFTGMAQVFTRGNTGVWTLAQTLTASDFAANAQFGVCTAIKGDWMAISAISVDGATQAVYIFNRISGTWLQTQKLTPGDLSTNDGYGSAIVIIGDFMFVGASGQATGTGAVYVYTLSGTWGQTQKITQSAGDNIGNGGNGISCDGTTLVIGAPGYQTGAGNGKAYVYTLGGGTWTLGTTLTASDGAAGDWFGYTVSVMEGLMCIGAPQATANGVASGVAYIFQGTGASWAQEQKLIPSDAVAGILYGWAASIFVAAGLDSWLAVSAVKGNDGGAPNPLQGDVYFYTAEPFDAPTTPAAQMAFYGVRRIQGGYSDPAPSLYPYYEKVFQIPFTFTISAAYNPALPFLSQGSRLLVHIRDYDFELRHITKYSVDAAGVPIPYPSPFAIILYDSTYVARMNGPLMAELLCDDLITPNGRNFWPSPPIMYKTDSSIPMDIFTMVEPVTINLPVTVTLLFDGVRRIPCV